MSSIDRHEVHQVLCMSLDHCAQYGREDGLLRFLTSLPGNGTLVRVARWIECFSPYRVQLDQHRNPISLVPVQGRGFDHTGAALTPYWRLRGDDPLSAD